MTSRFVSCGSKNKCDSFLPRIFLLAQDPAALLLKQPPISDRRLGDGSLEVMQGIDDFQEHLGGRLCLTLPDGIGRRRELHEVDHDLMADCLRELKEKAATNPGRTQPATGS